MRQPYPIPRRRIHVLLAAFLIFSLAITYRVVSFQVVNSKALTAEAESLRYRADEVPAERGNILDARGRTLALNEPADRVSAIVADVTDPARYAALLSPLIGRSASDILSAITQPGKEWVVLQRGLSDDTSAKIAALKLPGIVLDPELQRDYPMGGFTGQVLGFVNDNYDGSYGVEQSYNQILSGTPGKLVGERDINGNIIALANSVDDPPKPGANLVLNLDSAVQRIAEQALDQALAQHHAKSGSVVIENPRTGAILAMVSRPSYNPNDFASVTDSSLFSNPAVSQVYEPGSTFKTFTIGLGLETGAITPNTVHDSGSYFVLPGGEKVYNALLYDYGPETPELILENSSNLGAMWVAGQVGQDQFYSGVEAFGFGKPTGVDLPGESGGIVPLPGESSWSPANLYTNAFGQGLAVTPLQLVNAECVLANGGLLMTPHVVSQIQGDGSDQTIKPKVVRRVLSEQTTQEETAMLVQAVDHSQSYQKYIAVPGYAVAAKTGTAQIPSPSGGYESNATIASVVGYGPIPNPQFTVLVKIDQPQDTPWGESAAGPAFRQIMQQLFTLYGIPPTRSMNSVTPQP